MGAESKCTLTIGRQKTEGKALLETDALIFRGGDVRLSIPYKAMSSVDHRDGTLRVTYADSVARFELGPAAAKWSEKIRNPPSRADKLGIKRDQHVVFVGVKDDQFRAEVETCGAHLAARSNGQRAGSAADVIFYAADDRAALQRLSSLVDQLKRDGALWVIRPKGSAAISEADVMRAGKAAGLVDVKVVRFSDTHTAEKFVIPVKNR